MLICRTLVNDDSVTLLQEACAIVNNTPLCEVSEDPNDPIPLTPAALLTLSLQSLLQCNTLILKTYLRMESGGGGVPSICFKNFWLGGVNM